MPSSVGGPFGTAQLFRTPSSSRRKSQWRRRAWCSWTRKRSRLVLLFLELATEDSLVERDKPNYCAARRLNAIVPFKILRITPTKDADAVIATRYANRVV